MIEGIDVSHWQGTTPPLGGLGFLIAKATEGTAWDARFDDHIAAARAAGLVVGAYHFARSDVSLPDQAAAFIRRVKAAGITWTAIDVEAEHATSIAQTRTLVDLIHGAQLRVGLYHSLSGYFDAGQDWDWIAKWGVLPPARSWDVWQYQGSPLDRDRFAGSTSELRALAGEVMPPIKVGSQHASPFTISLIVGDQVYDESKRPLEKVATARVADGLFPTGDGWQAIVYDARSDAIGPRLALVKSADVAGRVKILPPADTAAAKREGYDLAVTGFRPNFPPRP